MASRRSGSRSGGRSGRWYVSGLSGRPVNADAKDNTNYRKAETAGQLLGGPFNTDAAARQSSAYTGATATAARKRSGGGSGGKATAWVKPKGVFGTRTTIVTQKASPGPGALGPYEGATVADAKQAARNAAVDQKLLKTRTTAGTRKSRNVPANTVWIETGERNRAGIPIRIKKGGETGEYARVASAAAAGDSRARQRLDQLNAMPTVTQGELNQRSAEKSAARRRSGGVDRRAQGQALFNRMASGAFQGTFCVKDTEGSNRAVRVSGGGGPSGKAKELAQLLGKPADVETEAFLRGIVESGSRWQKQYNPAGRVVQADCPKAPQRK